MARRSMWHRLALVLILMLVFLLAMSRDRPSVKHGKESGFSSPWQAVVRWMVPSGWERSWGRRSIPMESRGPARVVGVVDSARNGEFGLEIDPNG